jgi:predicted Zn-dependent peptidase
VEETLKEFRDIYGSRPLSQDELTSGRDGLLRGYPAGFERPGQVLGHLVQLVVHDLPDDYFRTVSGQLASVTLEQVHQAAVKRIRPDQLKGLVVGGRQEVEPGLRELGIPLVHLDSDGAEITY